MQRECDFPESNNDFVPFLGTQVRVSIEGNLEYKFYRKLQKKNITLHYKSHHPLKTKIEVIKNFYRAAEMSSFSPEYAEESFQVVDHLLVLRCNGYTNPRQMQLTRMTGLVMPKNTSNVMLKLPYISEYVSKEILRFIKKRKLPISVVFTPSKKLRDLLCSSRPYDKARCTMRNCRICANLEDNVTCTVKYPVYLITCNLCQEIYCGESSRSLHDRLSEHLRFATNSTKSSYNYKDEALAIHYRDHHHGLKPNLSFRLLETEPKTVNRKILEAMYIHKLEPKLNDKEECILLKRFLID